MQQASAAFTSAEAEVFGMQRASSDQSAVSCSTQHDSDAGSAHMPSLSGCCDDLFMEEYLETDHAQAPADARCRVDTVHYSRHQVNFCYVTAEPGHHFIVPSKLPGALQKPHSDMYCVQGAHHRPAVRWQNNADILESAQSRHSPQHLILSPNKSCMKQVYTNELLLHVCLLGMPVFLSSVGCQGPWAPVCTQAPVCI